MIEHPDNALLSGSFFFRLPEQKPLQNEYLWHISALGLRSKSRLTTCYVFDFCATTP